MTEKKGLFSRLREGLFKSREHMSVAMEAAVQDDRPIDEDFYDDLLDALILSDMGAPCATRPSTACASASERSTCATRRRPRRRSRAFWWRCWRWKNPPCTGPW